MRRIRQPLCGEGSHQRAPTDTGVPVSSSGKMRAKLPGGCSEWVQGGSDGDPTPSGHFDS